MVTRFRAGIVALLLLLVEPVAHAQWITFDAINNIIHQAMQYLQDPSFKALVKGVEDLSKITGAVRQFHRGAEAVNNVAKCTQKINTIAQLARVDGHINKSDYQAIGQVLKEFNDECSSILKDAKSGLSGSSGSVMKMEDGDRMEWLDKIATKTLALNGKLDGLLTLMKRRSMSRAFTANDLNATSSLYGVAASRFRRINNRTGMTFSGGDADVYADANYQGGYSTDGYDDSEGARAKRAALQRYQNEMEKYQIQLEVYEDQISVDGARWLFLAGGFKPYFDKEEKEFIGFIGPDGTRYTEDQMTRLAKIKGRELVGDNDPNRPKPPAPPKFGG